MRQNKFFVCDEKNKIKNNELNIINGKIKNKIKDLSINTINFSGSIDKNSNLKVFEKYKIIPKFKSQRSENPISFNDSPNKSKVIYQKLKRNSTEKYYKENQYPIFEKPKNMNIQTFNINYFYNNHFKKKKNEETFPLINNNNTNIENSTNINYSNSINNFNKNIYNNNHFYNNFIQQRKYNKEKNYFKNKIKKVRISELKKNKNHNNVFFNSERPNIKSLQFFTNIKKENSQPIILNNKKEDKLLNLIEDNNDSFIDEINDLFIDDFKKCKIKKDFIFNKLNTNECDNEINDLSEKFGIYKEKENNYQEKKEKEITIPNIKFNKCFFRPTTSYGGINDRKKSIKYSQKFHS